MKEGDKCDDDDDCDFSLACIHLYEASHPTCIRFGTLEDGVKYTYPKLNNMNLHSSFQPIPGYNLKLSSPPSTLTSSTDLIPAWICHSGIMVTINNINQ
mmetsp:Transcript_12992/g.11499  ORF Transcript_12992/g.11499 Transcript_12992/m.11499 type:complete len:99 (+) Transcript_12992:60-356(+)